MKSFVATAAALAALSSTADAATCSSAVLSALLTNQYIEQCSTDSGYVFTAATIPSQETIDKMCASSACRSLLADAQAMDLTECTLPVGDNINLLADLVDYVPPRCPSASGSAETGNSTTATTTTGSTTTDATAGSAATGATVGSTTGSGSNSESVTAPADSTSSSAGSSPSTTTVPTAASDASASTAASESTSGSSAASSVAQAMGAAAFAAAAVAAYFL
ncbi:hypothetical protein PHYBOEH_011850 [Phytophthora boehmeriae]|uniref:Elicitin n=1 Tax=Phytophthora boehmeriae TaxID=109152 RepID=A0A8T1X0L2_9STRA|nr:hypothetical protein PHYBOEH_011850 [Phytophthora boehmeriae]